VTIYGAAFSGVYDREWAFWAEHLWPLLAQEAPANRPEARAWLDLCCGGGHLLRHVCAAGDLGVGLDLSPHQLAIARRNAPSAHLLQADVRAFEFGRAFHVVTCLFDSLNYLTDPVDLAGVFARVARHLRGEGLFALDMNTFEGLQDAWNRAGTVPCGEERVIIETSFDPRTALGRAIISGFAAGEAAVPRFVEEHVERGYRRAEVEALLADAGFTCEALDGHSLQAPEPRSARLLWLCRRNGGGSAAPA
jgi:SAM-dependent methyltransferase